MQQASYHYYNQRLVSNKANAPMVSIKGWIVMQRVACMPIELIQLSKLERDVIINHSILMTIYDS